jgi:lipoprotein-releasing system permease protein
LNLPLFIAKKIATGRGKSFSGLIIRIAIAGIAVSLAIMIISIAIVTGFKQEIRDKVIGFGSHIQIVKTDMNQSFENVPVRNDPGLHTSVRNITGVEHTQVFATKAGIIKTDEEIEGIVLKGISTDFNWNFFNSKIVEGTSFSASDTTTSNKVMISKHTADRMKLKVGDKMMVYFLQGSPTPRARVLNVSGIFNSGLEEFDQLYALCDIRQIQQLNKWEPEMVGGFEVFINDFERLDDITKEVNGEIGIYLEARSIKRINPQIFDWLELLNVNVQVIIALMIAVASINMITALLILIIERTNMIGILKALGATSGKISFIFLFKAAYLILTGLFWGNLLGLGLCLLQLNTGLITLPQESYYVAVVPVNIDWMDILLLNIATFMLCLIIMILPSQMVSRVSPVKAIRFD